jgi:hypothetical protein
VQNIPKLNSGVDFVFWTPWLNTPEAHKYAALIFFEELRGAGGLKWRNQVNNHMV